MSDDSSRSQNRAAIHQDVCIHLTPLNWKLLATFRLLHHENSIAAVTILDPHVRVWVIGPAIPRQNDESHGIVRCRKDRLTRHNNRILEERSSGLACFDWGICGESRGRKVAPGFARTPTAR